MGLYKSCLTKEKTMSKKSDALISYQEKRKAEKRADLIASLPWVIMTIAWTIYVLAQLATIKN